MGSPPHAPQPAMKWPHEAAAIGRAQVGALLPLDVAPEGFDGIELGGVGGQSFDREPGPVGPEIPRHDPAPVRRQAIPEQDRPRAAEVATQCAEEVDDGWAAIRGRAGLEVQPDPPAVPAKGQGGRDRPALPVVERVRQDGRLAPGRPGAADDRELREPAFVREDEPGVPAAGVFVPAASGLASTAESPARPVRGLAGPAVGVTSSTSAEAATRARDGAGPRSAARAPWQSAGASRDRSETHGPAGHGAGPDRAGPTAPRLASACVPTDRPPLARSCRGSATSGTTDGPRPGSRRMPERPPLGTRPAQPTAPPRRGALPTLPPRFVWPCLNMASYPTNPLTYSARIIRSVSRHAGLCEDRSGTSVNGDGTRY
jgi:hypothetical protein